MARRLRTKAVKQTLRIRVSPENERNLRAIQRANWRRGKRVSVTELVNSALASEYSTEFVRQFTVTCSECPEKREQQSVNHAWVTGVTDGD